MEGPTVLVGFQGLLGGSSVVIGGAISAPIWVIIIVTPLVTPVITAHVGSASAEFWGSSIGSGFRIGCLGSCVRWLNAGFLHMLSRQMTRIPIRYGPAVHNALPGTFMWGAR